MTKVLALTKDGKLTYCTASPEMRGKGRCTHTAHQEEKQSAEDFIEKINAINLNFNDCEAGLIQKDERFQLIKDSLPNFGSENHGILSTDISLRMNDRARGVQAKGPIIINENDKSYLKFLKLDEINISTGLRFLDHVDYHYSSISEELSSSLLSSIQNLEDFNHLLYSFHVVKDKGAEVTGVLSENYLYNGGDYGISEQCLSIETAKINLGDDVRVDHDDFVANVVDCRDDNKILKSMIRYYKEYGVKEHDAKDFILKQAAFDVLTCNYDRKPNAANSIFVTDHETGITKPMNIDYGRCYVLEVGLDSYDKIRNFKLDKNETMEGVIKESVDVYKDEYMAKGSIFAKALSSDIKETVDFILENGFEPFEIDIKKLNEKRNDLRKKVKVYKNGYLETFVEMKINMMDTMLFHPDMKRLWREL